MKREQSPRGPDQHPCLAYVGAIAGYTRSSAITPQIAKYPARSLWAGLPYSLLGVLAFRYSHWPDSTPLHIYAGQTAVAHRRVAHRIHAPFAIRDLPSQTFTTHVFRPGHQARF